LANVGAGAVHRELKRLEQAGLVTVTRVGNQKHFQANSRSPVFEEIRGLVIKTCGVADVIREALSDVLDRVTAAFVFGSLARGEDSGSSDIDLMVLSEDLSYADLFGALEPASRRLGRTVNPTVYSLEELSRKGDQKNEFVLRVLEQPKIWIIGGDGDLTAG
jgi:predicted nucleotidyltransferase